MQAEIICVGTELLLGQIINTNGPIWQRNWPGLVLTLPLSTVGDNLPRLTALLQQAWERVDGSSPVAGPDLDDLTRRPWLTCWGGNGGGPSPADDEEASARRGVPMPSQISGRHSGRGPLSVL